MVRSCELGSFKLHLVFFMKEKIPGSIKYEGTDCSCIINRSGMRKKKGGGYFTLALKVILKGSQ